MNDTIVKCRLEWSCSDLTVTISPCALPYKMNVSPLSLSYCYFVFSISEACRNVDWMKKCGNLYQSVNKIFTQNFHRNCQRTFFLQNCQSYTFNNNNSRFISSVSSALIHQIGSGKSVQNHLLFIQRESIPLICRRHLQTSQYFYNCQEDSEPTWFVAMSDNKFCIDYAKRQVTFSIYFIDKFKLSI